MNVPTRLARTAALLWLFLAACDTDVKTDTAVVARDTLIDTVYVSASNPADSAAFLDSMATPVTLPVIDGFLQDSAFVAMLRDSLRLSDAQLTDLRRAAREEAARLDSGAIAGDTVAAGTAMAGGTWVARQRALERIGAIIGPQKTYDLGRLVRSRWAADTLAGVSMAADPNSIPTDTRIVINAPSFRLDLFENGQLVKSFPFASGYPEFPLPTGMRRATQIIFNPAWVPPDEPWVESSNKVKVGERVEPGSRDNPLGVLKIPIGGPSLIHGGKAQRQLGTFGSHGCAGLTNELARELAKLMAAATGTELTDKQVAAYAKNPTESQTVQLAQPIAVELRYETIVVQDGAVHLYPDVYDHGMNTEANLRAVLQAHGVTLEQLTEAERAKLIDALAQMSPGLARAGGDTAAASRSGDTARGEVRLTRSVKGPKELTVPIAALKGKGYPKPMKVAKRPPAIEKPSDTTA